MVITELEAVAGFIRMCDDGYYMGWHERNGGNCSYRMKAGEAELCRPFFYERPADWTPIGAAAPNLAGEFFLVTGSGKYMRNIKENAEDNICVIEINGRGDACRVVWGLAGGGAPTSELASHMLNHSVKKNVSGGVSRVIYHAHPTNVVALTFVLPLSSRDFSRALWRSMTECPLVFPAGVGVVPWMVPGGAEIASASAGLMRGHDAVIWAHHGVFCSGESFDLAFGLMHTIEKSAEIYIKAESCGRNPRQTISDEQLLAAAAAFGVKLNEAYIQKS